MPVSIVIPTSNEAHRHEDGGTDLLRSPCHQARDAGIVCEFSQVIGAPSKIVCAIAATWGADLTVVDRRGGDSAISG